LSVVLDASAAVNLLLGVLPPAGVATLDRPLVAPELLPIEVTSALARLWRRGDLGARDARQLLDAFGALPIELLTVRHLLGEVFALSDRLSVYDAAYVALAADEGLDLVTADRRLARTHGLPVDVLVV
jgi:predicted nucleic acid-binding protein